MATVTEFGDPVWIKETATAANVVTTFIVNSTGGREAVQVYAVYASFKGAPTGGGLTVAVDGSTVFDVDITSEGPHVFDFTAWQRGGVVGAVNLVGSTSGESVVVTLTNSGAGVVGKTSILYGAG